MQAGPKISTFFLFTTILIVSGLTSKTANRCKNVQDDAFINNPATCKSYFKCINGQALAKDCPGEFFFNKLTGTCDYQSNVICDDQVNVNPCTNQPDKSFVNDPRSCSSFFYCNNGTVESYDCTNGLFYDPTINECVYQNDIECNDNESDTNILNICEGVPNGIFIRDEKDCSKFYVCVQEVKAPLSCSDGAYFDLKTASCVQKENVQCKNIDEDIPACAEAPNGAFVKEPSKCAGWLQCIDGKISKHGLCPPNQWFSKGACQWWWFVSEIECKNRCEGKAHGFVVAPGSNCRGYYNCKDGNLNGDKMLCGDNLIFDINSEHCVPNSMSSVCIVP